MKKTNKISFSALTTYTECGYKYKLHYIERLRPIKTKSSLLFGKALDGALNELLESKDLKLSLKVFRHLWREQEINDVKENLYTSPNVIYTKADTDLELLPKKYTEQKDKYTSSQLAWLSLLKKGNLFIHTYYYHILPKFTKVRVVQKELKLYNEDGDYIHGFIDLIADISDKTYLLDNKTTSFKYPLDAVYNSPQLATYSYIEDDIKLDGEGFIVLNKNIIKNRTKICSKCGHDGSDAGFKTCNNIINNKRCDSKWIISIRPSVEYQILLGKISDYKKDSVVEAYDKANSEILNEQFDKNEKSCIGKYGKCTYYELCKYGSRKAYVKV